MEWMPIASAPKDGTEILILSPINWCEEARDKNDSRVGAGCFCQSAWFDKIRCVWSNRLAQWTKKDTPTHWMPILEPPKEN